MNKAFMKSPVISELYSQKLYFFCYVESILLISKNFKILKTIVKHNLVLIKIDLDLSTQSDKIKPTLLLSTTIKTMIKLQNRMQTS